MRTFLAGFCAPGGPLAKAVGIFFRGPSGAQKPARNVRIPMLKIFREVSF